MDAITLLRNDHKRIEGLFSSFEETGERAMKSRKRLADRMVTELTAHAVLEEQVFYPLVLESVAMSMASCSRASKSIMSCAS
jgi:hemerythrin superfamily protein